jgi:hypothetical protein
MWLIYVLWPVFMVVSAIVARRRGRSTLGWLLLGLLLGPIAVAALFVLPDLTVAQSHPAAPEIKEEITPDLEVPDA